MESPRIARAWMAPLILAVLSPAAGAAPPAWKARAARLAHRAAAGPPSAADRLARLHDRRDRAPARFDRDHPALGRLLARDDALRAALDADCRPLAGLLPDTPRTRYLRFRRGLAPARFDRYHPALGAILAEDARLRRAAGCTSSLLLPPGAIAPPNPGTPEGAPPLGGQLIPPRAVPEPPAALTLLIGAATLAAARSMGRPGRRHARCIAR